MKTIFKTTIITTFMIFFTSIISAVVIEVPDSNRDDDVIVQGSTTIQGSEKNIFILIQQINDYLWFSIGAICLGILVYGGIRLMTASGDEEKMKQTNKLLTGALIGIVISVISYSLVRLLVNIF